MCLATNSVFDTPSHICRSAHHERAPHVAEQLRQRTCVPCVSSPKATAHKHRARELAGQDQAAPFSEQGFALPRLKYKNLFLEPHVLDGFLNPCPWHFELLLWMPSSQNPLWHGWSTGARSPVSTPSFQQAFWTLGSDHAVGSIRAHRTHSEVLRAGGLQGHFPKHMKATQNDPNLFPQSF